jgi:hypothetical protein
MKKVTMSLVLLFLVFPFAVSALDLSAGVKAGGGIGLLSGADWQNELNEAEAENEIRLAYGGSLFVALRILDLLTIEPAVTYTVTGGAYSIGPTGEEGIVTANVFTVPVYLGVQFAGLYLLGGPSWYFFPETVEQVEGGVSENVAVDNRTVMGISAAVGYAFPIGIGNLLAELKYSRTLGDVFTDSDTVFNTLIFQLGFML